MTDEQILSCIYETTEQGTYKTLGGIDENSKEDMDDFDGEIHVYEHQISADGIDEMRAVYGLRNNILILLTAYPLNGPAVQVYSTPLNHFFRGYTNGQVRAITNVIRSWNDDVREKFYQRTEPWEEWVAVHLANLLSGFDQTLIEGLLDRIAGWDKTKAINIIKNYITLSTDERQALFNLTAGKSDTEMLYLSRRWSAVKEQIKDCDSGSQQRIMSRTEQMNKHNAIRFATAFRDIDQRLTNELLDRMGGWSDKQAIEIAENYAKLSADEQLRLHTDTAGRSPTEVHSISRRRVGWRPSGRS
jgi:hypothetical protein